MKKVLFTTMSIIAAAAMMFVSCKKENGTDNGGGQEQQQTVDPELVGTWTITGEAQGWAADGGVAMTESNNVWTVAEVAVKGEGFKFVKDGAWTVNLGAAEAGAKADDVEFDLNKDGSNITGTAGDGIYSVTLNLLTKKAKIKFVSELPKEGQDWDYVLDMTDWHINSTFMFDEVEKPIKLDPASVTFQVKFFSKKWNNHKFGDKDENGYTLYCNRLGEFSNAAESQTVLLRFSNDGSADGQLCLNAGFLGLNQDQIAVDGTPYVWSVGEWHVITITSDGTNLSVYDNETLIKTYSQSGLGDEWKFARYDLSMTWKEGSTDNDWPLRQAFNGYIAYSRVWSKVLTAEEVAASLCDVPADSDGLQVYWAFNCDEGSVVENLAANKEFALDFTKAWDGNGSKNNTATYAEAGWTAVEEITNGTVCPVAE